MSTRRGRIVAIVIAAGLLVPMTAIASGAATPTDLPPAPCQPGTFSATGAAPCTPAPTGTFVDIEGATSATPCAPGSYSAVMGSAWCTLAQAGTFVDVPGASAPSPCPPGTTSLAMGAISCTSTNPPTDGTPPVISASVVGTLGTDGWYTSDVTVTWTVVDDESSAVASNDCATSSITADTSGVTLTCAATSEGGTTTEQLTIKRDATAPTLDPVVSPNPVARGAAVSVAANAADAGSGLATTSCGAVSSATAGSRSVTCTATDRAGNTASATVGYQVEGPWRGFVGLAPLPTMNPYFAGVPVPLLFSIGGNQGTGILAGTPTSQRVDCTTGAAVGNSAAVDARSSLTYVRIGDAYVYAWWTDRAWRGTCRVFSLRLTDGSTHRVGFSFR